MKLLIVEDAARLRQTLMISLTKSGHVVDSAPDGAEAWTMLTGHSYDVIVLDIMLPEVDGLTILERMRRRGDTTPVLLLTARDAIEDRVRGLMSGADDYLVKPFSLAELEARIITLHRRRHGVVHSRFQAGPLEIDAAMRKVFRDGHEILLTTREFALLEFLAMRPGRVFTREQIEAALYTDSTPPLSNAVDSAVCLLRKKLSPDGGPPLVQTRRGLGYCFAAA
jgi:DNA-binding response OmpR family regulator